MKPLLSVQDALHRILADVIRMPSENVELSKASGRVLATDVATLRTQPPFPASAMDGYAVNAADISIVPCTLTQIGESAAGHGFTGSISSGECVRIFTGAPVPDGADTIVIQENTSADGNQITVQQSEQAGRYVRPAGLDFSKGEVLLQEGEVLNATTVSLAAAMNHPALPVRRKPKVAIIASGDELLLPGSIPAVDQIIASNSFGVADIVKQAGANAIDLGIAADTLEALDEKFEKASDADIVVTLGGASIGDHDLVHQALRNRGVDLDFWKLAMRPGKPVMFGRHNAQRYLGLPGNPVSSLVCALVFVVPLIRAHLGLDTQTPKQKAVLAVNLPENDQREEYMRAVYETRDGQLHVTPFDKQDSSIISLMAKANCLMIRPAFAPASQVGDICTIIKL